MDPPRPPRDPKRPKPPRAGKAEDKRAKSPSAAARDARRAEQHATTRPERKAPPPGLQKAVAPDRRRGRSAGHSAGGPAARPVSASTPGRADRKPRDTPPANRADRAPRRDASDHPGDPAAPSARFGRPTRPERPRAPARPPRETAPPSGRPDRAPRREASDRPRDPARPARAPSAARPGRPPAADRPPPRADRPDRPDRGERPAFATRAGRAAATRPDRKPRPDTPPARHPSPADAPRRGAARHQRTAAAPRATASEAPGEGQRIAKLLARAGIASRREIERMIEEGRVAIGGAVIETPATILKSLHDVTVDGRPVQAAAPARLFRYHKSAGLLTAERDPAGRATIYDRLPAGLPRLMPVGRLDLNTEGLLLLTTDGELKRQLELPATGVERAYRARVFGDVSQAQLEELIDGVEIEGVRYGAIDANLERRTGRNGWLEMRLREGKNREVRRVLEYLGLQVSRLIRTAYGPFPLAEMAPGEVDEVRQHDLIAFRKSLKQAS